MWPFPVQLLEGLIEGHTQWEGGECQLHPLGTLPTTLQEPFYQSCQGPEEEIEAFEALCSEVSLCQYFKEPLLAPFLSSTIPA